MSLVLLFALLFRHFFRVFFFRGIHIVDWYWDKTPKIPSFLDDDPISSGTTKSRHRCNFHQASSRQSLLWVKSFGPATNCEDSPLLGGFQEQQKPLLLGGFNHLEKWWTSSVGMMTFPTEWKVIKFMETKPPTRLKSPTGPTPTHWYGYRLATATAWVFQTPNFFSCSSSFVEFSTGGIGGIPELVPLFPDPRPCTAGPSCPSGSPHHRRIGRWVLGRGSATPRGHGMEFPPGFLEVFQWYLLLVQYV